MQYRTLPPTSGVKSGAVGVESSPPLAPLSFALLGRGVVFRLVYLYILLLFVLLCLGGIDKRGIVIAITLASFKLIFDSPLLDPFLSQGPPPIQFVVIDWGDWLAYVALSASVEIIGRRLSSF